MYDVEKIEKSIRKELSDFRYQHTKLVAMEAINLANHYQVERQKAYVAGLLHDIAKEYSREKNINLIEKYNLSPRLKEEEFENIIHADIGAEVAREYYHVDEDIYRAIQYHTIGNKDMDILAKIVFVADKVGRESLSLEMQEIKRVAYENIDEAIYRFLLMQKEKLKNKGRSLHPDTIQLLNRIRDQ